MNRLPINVLKQLVKNGRGLWIPVHGNSMEPAIYAGDNVFVEIAEVYRLGDVLVFSYYQSIYLTIHRLVHIGKNSYICKGDNSFNLEELQSTQILGKATKLKHLEHESKIFTPSEAVLELSFEVGKLFCAQELDGQKAKIAPLYRDFYLQYQKEMGYFAQNGEGGSVNDV